MSPRKTVATEPAAEAAPAVEAATAVEQTPAVETAPTPAVEAAPAGAPAHKRVFRISRRRSGEAGPVRLDVTVEVEPGDTVLDALLRIRRTSEPSLVVRHSCMHASCGTCGIRINGRESLACDTRVDSISPEPVARSSPGKSAKPPNTIEVEPLTGQRVVADLATDMVDFYARFEAADMPLVRDAEAAPGTEPPDGIRAFGHFENCVECGLCLSACPVARRNHDYIGPAALAAAARVVDEPRGVDLGPALALAAEPDSIWRCRDILECSAVCPAGVEPARAILTLRRHVAARQTRRFLGGQD